MATQTAYQKKYKSKFLDPQWQQFRLKIFQRDNFSCVRCGATDRQLHAHHTYYQEFGTDPWEYEYDTVITLCDICHEDEHIHLKSANKRLLDSLSSTGVSWKGKVALSTAFDVTNRKLPVDYWDVMMMVFMDDNFYTIAREKYYNDKDDERIELVKELNIGNIVYLLTEEYE